MYYKAEQIITHYFGANQLSLYQEYFPTLEVNIIAQLCIEHNRIEEFTLLIPHLPGGISLDVKKNLLDHGYQDVVQRHQNMFAAV
jgi:hypothetical protein